jgi:hypothetical protein
MTAISRRRHDGLRSVGLVAILSAAGIAACDPTGSAVFAVNESDHDMIVVVQAGLAPNGRRVPAHTQGPVYNTFSPPGEHWSVTLYDASCQALMEFPIRSNGSTVHIRSDGGATLELEDQFVAGIDTAPLAEADCP